MNKPEKAHHTSGSTSNTRKIWGSPNAPFNPNWRLADSELSHTRRGRTLIAKLRKSLKELGTQPSCTRVVAITHEVADTLRLCADAYEDLLVKYYYRPPYRYAPWKDLYMLDTPLNDLIKAATKADEAMRKLAKLQRLTQSAFEEVYSPVEETATDLAAWIRDKFSLADALVAEARRTRKERRRKAA